MNQLLRRLRSLVGDDHVIESPELRLLYSQDVYRAGRLPAAIVRPGTADEVASVARMATDASTAIFVRGGGMSYTDAYLPDREAAVVLDTTRLTRVREIAVEDLHCTVEAGCTWADLDAALAPLGVRAQFWGPMSGRRATIGGAFSQGAVTFGSGRHGPSGASALGFEVALANGELLETSGAARTGRAPFFRHYGPDLTGLFAGDAGALGIKTAVTLQLTPRPSQGDGFTFAFPDFAALRRAVSAVSRAGLATELFGLDGALARRVAGNQSAEQAVDAWLAAGRAQSSRFGAMRQMARIAWHGKRFLEGSPFIGNFLFEAEDPAALARVGDQLREVVNPFGMEIANTIATLTRASPFPEPLVLGPDGMRLLPLHGIFPHSVAEAFHAAFENLLATKFADREQLGVSVYTVFASCGPSGFLHEPVIYWPDSWPEFHHATMSPTMLANWRESAPNPAARAYVERMRVAIIELMFEHGASHLQIGRAYPYLRDRAPAFLALLSAIKAQLDPKRLINPGALGL